MTLEKSMSLQFSFHEKLTRRIQNLPLNHCFAKEVLDTLDECLADDPLNREKKELLLGLAFDVHSLRILEHTEEMNERVAAWKLAGDVT